MLIFSNRTITLRYASLEIKYSHILKLIDILLNDLKINQEFISYTLFFA